MHGAPDAFRRDRQHERFFDHLSSWQNGELQQPALPTRRGRNLVIRWTGFHLHIDDDIWPEEGVVPPATAAIDVTVEPRALRVWVPGEKNE